MEHHYGRAFYSVDLTHAKREKLDKPPEKKCGRFWCKIVNEAACCIACPRFMSCDAACLNDPERCGLALEE